MNMALHRAFAAHRRMELSAQEGKDLAETLLRVASTINTTLEQDRVSALDLGPVGPCCSIRQRLHHVDRR